MSNKDIKHAIKKAGLSQWQVADAYGLHESNFSRLLRKELSLEQKVKVYNAIKSAEKTLLKREAINS